MPPNEISPRTRRILKALFDRSRPVTALTVEARQSDLAKELKITRQALNIHLKKLRDDRYIRTGRGFIDIMEAGLPLLGKTGQPTFVFTRISPGKRESAYREISKLPTKSIHRVTGDMDLVIVVEREKLDDILKAISSINGVEETKSYVAIEALK